MADIRSLISQIPMEPGYVPAPPEPDLSVIQRLMGLPQTLRAVGQNLAVGAASLPVGIYQGFGNPAAGEAAMSQFQQEYGYTPTNPAAQRQLQGLGEFLQQLETEYKIPPMISPSQLPSRAATAGSAMQLGRIGTRMTGQAQNLARDLVREIQTTPPTGAVTMAPKIDDVPQMPRESFVEGVPAGQELIVHHNITPEKLRKVEKVGGMPVPSIAISNVENPMSGFGEISLIGNPSMANPSAKNPVFGFDAYTARAPGIDYKIDSKSQKALEGMLSDIAKKVPGGDYRVDRLVNNWEDRQYSEVLRAKFLEDSGYGLPDREMFPEAWQFEGEVNRRVRDLSGDYNNWLASFEESLPSQGVNVQEKIFKGFTQSGNRRYADVTLENLVREMKGGAGSENWNYGVGNLRAVATPKFRKFNDIKASREKIVASEDFAKVKDEVDNAYSSLLTRIDELPNQDRYGYKSEDVLYEIGSSRNVNMIETFKTDVPEELKADIGVFMRKLNQLPTEYFEIKPQRAVKVSEFEGAIVPVDAPKNSIDYLRSQGIDRIYYYSTPEERKELFKQFGDKMFSAVPAVGAGLLGAGMMQEEEQF
jgi:hypothetical protein